LPRLPIQELSERLTRSRLLVVWGLKGGETETIRPPEWVEQNSSQEKRRAWSSFFSDWRGSTTTKVRSNWCRIDSLIGWAIWRW